MRTKRITLAEVAERAGVSKITASAVLAGSDKNARFSDATRDRVVAAAAELGYVRSALARSLRQGSTNTVGFYTGFNYADMREPFFASLASGFQKACDRHGKDLLLHGTFRVNASPAILSEFADGRIDGLVLMAPPNDAVVESVRRLRLPCVTVAQRFQGLPYVVPDEERGMALAAEHLAARGHRRVVFKGGVHGERDALVRERAFAAAAANEGLVIVPSRPGHWDGDLGPDLASWRTMPAGERPTALVAWRETVAYAVLDQLLQAGLRVPEDVAVCAFDGLPTWAPPARRLTTVDAHWALVAERAVEALLGSPPLGERLSEVLPVDLRVGDTT